MKNTLVFNCMMKEMWRGMMSMTQSPLQRCALMKNQPRDRPA